MLVGESAQIQARFGQYHLRGPGANPVNAREIYPVEPPDCRAHGLLAPLRHGLVFVRVGMRGRVEAMALGRLQRLDLLDQLLFILANHLFEPVIQLERSAQVEKMLPAPVADEVLGELGLALSAAFCPAGWPAFWDCAARPRWPG